MMSENSELTLPEPIPYPKGRFIKKLYKTPVLLYRLGLAPLIGRYILILTTTGRKSGKIRRTPVEYFQKDGRFYIISGFGTQPDWYRNLQADPHITLQNHQATLSAIARRPKTDQEWTAVLSYLKHSPITRYLMPETQAQLESPDIQEALKTFLPSPSMPQMNPAHPL